MWRIEFTSDKFLPYLPEDSQSNPGVYGFELAHWLSVGLAKRDVVTSYPLGEDWGWFLEYPHDELELMICCSSLAEEGEGYRRAPIGWSVFIRGPGGLFKRKKSPEIDAAVALLSKQVTEMLRNEGITMNVVED